MPTIPGAGRSDAHLFRRSAGTILLLLSLVMLALSPPSFALPGDLDPTFSPDGIPGISIFGFDNVADEGRAIVVTQPDGKIVVGGYTADAGHDDFLLLRYNPDGSLDPGFDGDGIVTLNFFNRQTGENGNERINALVRHSDGKLVAAGYTDLFGDIDIFLGRFNVDGSIDRTFANRGVTCCFLLGNDEARALMVQPADGRLVVAGYNDFLGTRDVVVFRFEENGVLDGSFAPGGGGAVRIFSLLGADYEAHALARQPNDGKLVVAGFTDEGGSDDFALFRVNPNGDSLDTSFFTGGGVRILFRTRQGADLQDRANALVLQPDGKLVVSGVTSDGATSGFALARLNPDGALDRDFGFLDGGLITPFGEGTMSESRALVLQPDGKIVEAGFARFGEDIDFALVRHNSDGSLDANFGFGGATLTDFNQGSADSIFALAPQSDGSLVAAGTSCTVPADPASCHFATARYESGPVGRLAGRSERVSSRMLTPGKVFGHALTPGDVLCKGRPVTILGTSGNDLLRGTIGDDVILGMNGDDTIFGFEGNDVICGGRGTDVLIGGDGADRLFGQTGLDLIFGGRGRDKLNGGRAVDVCNHGKGAKGATKGCENLASGARPPKEPPRPPRRQAFSPRTLPASVTGAPPALPRSRAAAGAWGISGLGDMLRQGTADRAAAVGVSSGNR